MGDGTLEGGDKVLGVFSERNSTIIVALKESHYLVCKFED
jgi:hypothetical protein